jgi:hypothetical protein
MTLETKQVLYQCNVHGLTPSAVTFEEKSMPEISGHYCTACMFEFLYKTIGKIEKVESDDI